MKTKKRSRLIVIFLSFLVCMSLMPITAFAEDDGLQITNNGSLPNIIVGQSYEYQFNTNSLGSVTWGKGKNWPSWLELDSSTGKIHGTPPSAQNVSTQIRVYCKGSDGLTRVTIGLVWFNVYPQRPELVAKKGHGDSYVNISGTNLPDATQNSNYLGEDKILFSDSFPNSIMTINITSVPDGMETLFSTDGRYLDGTPTKVGTYSIKISLSTYVDSEKTKLIGTTEKTFTLKVNPDGSTPQEEVTVTFDKNGGSGTMADVTVNKDSNYTLPACTFTAPDGKEFKAWEVGGIEKAVGDSITVNANTTVKVLWKDKPVTPVEKVKVTFDKNGGSGTMTDATVDKGSSYTLPACTFTAPTGKEFKTWEVRGVEKAVGDSITVGANTTVKALWKQKPPVKYTVSFDKNGGSGSMADVTKNVGETYVLPDCGFTAPTGKAFKAWEVGGVEKAVGDNITVNANTTVKAIWKDKLITNYTVTVTDGTADKATAQEGDTVTITANAAPSGQVFAGWEIVFGKFAIEDMTAATTTLTIGTTNVEIKARYNPAPAEHETYTVMVASPISNGSVSVDNDIELWEGDTITITVAPDMGYELSELIAKDDDENSISITKASDTEYTFDMPAANVRVNATFKEKTGGTVMPQTSTITINPNGGKWADNTTTAKNFEVQVGNTFTIPEAPKRDGYTFLYWEGSRYNPGEQYLVTALDHTFTAVWQKNEVKPTNENTSSVNTKKVDKTSSKTGDNGMIYVYALELLMAASIILILKARRNRNNLK